MKSLNKVTFIGHLGGTPELDTRANSPFTKFQIATQYVFQDEQNNWHTRTDWHPVVVWGRKAEQIVKYCEKGSKIYMEGELKHRTYEDKEGRTIYITEVKLIDFSLASGLKNANSKVEQPVIPQDKIDELTEEGDDSDLPF